MSFFQQVKLHDIVQIEKQFGSKYYRGVSSFKFFFFFFFEKFSMRNFLIESSK